MANLLYIPLLNPVKFYRPSPDTTYESRDIDDFEFADSIPEWEPQLDYYQPWQTSDNIPLYLLSDFGPHNVKIIDVNNYDNVVDTLSFAKIAQSEDNPGLWVYQLDIDMSVYNTGVYRLQLESGIDDKLILVSNKIDLCERHKHSLYLSYKHYQYHEGVMFKTGITFNFRVEGSIKFKSPASKDEDFEDQTLDESLLSSVPYRTYELIIGDAEGVPPYVIDLVNRIFTCSDVTIDGKQYVKPKESKWEANELEDYPAKGWKTELREALNRPSRIFSSNQPIGSKIAIVINADSKGFGTDTGGNTHQITDVQ